MARLRKERADLDKKHQHTIATLQKKLKQVNKRLSEQRNAAAAEAAAAATAASNAVAEPTARAAELQEQAAKLQAELNAAVASSRETAAAIMAAEAARDAACGRAAVAESAVAELQAQLAHAVADKERGLEAAQRQSAAAGRVTEDLRQELESVRQDGRRLQLKVEGIAALEAQLHSAEQGQAAAQAQADAREGTAPSSLHIPCCQPCICRLLLQTADHLADNGDAAEPWRFYYILFRLQPGVGSHRGAWGEGRGTQLLQAPRRCRAERIHIGAELQMKQLLP